MENYCRYRLGKKAKQSAVVRRGDVVIDDDCEFRNAADESVVTRKCVAKGGHVRDYELVPGGNVVNVHSWLMLQEILEACVCCFV